MLVCVCGSRHWTNRAAIERELRTVKERSEVSGLPVIIVHGGARGADTLAGEVAESLGLEVWERPAQWETLGVAAGMIRNQSIIDMRPSRVLAFTEDMERSRGTNDMVRRAVAACIPVTVFKE